MMKNYLLVVEIGALFIYLAITAIKWMGIFIIIILLLSLISVTIN